MYFVTNYASKAAARRAIAAGDEVRIKSMSQFEEAPLNGSASVEGPHYPKPHTFYGTATVVNGLVTSIS